jgi:hypothetical protein
MNSTTQASALREAIEDAADEWARYVLADTAPTNLTAHMLRAFDAALGVAATSAGAQPTGFLIRHKAAVRAAERFEAGVDTGYGTDKPRDDYPTRGSPSSLLDALAVPAPVQAGELNSAGETPIQHTHRWATELACSLAGGSWNREDRDLPRHP